MSLFGNIDAIDRAASDGMPARYAADELLASSWRIGRRLAEEKCPKNKVVQRGDVSQVALQRAAGCIKDYYSPSPYEAIKGDKAAPLERARQQYIAAMEANIEAARAVQLRDLFPKMKAEA